MKIDNMGQKTIIILIFSILLILGCNQQSINDPAPQPPVKKPIKGLVTMGSVRDMRNGNFDVLKVANIYPDIFSGVVIKATWGELEPQRGYFDFTGINKALNDIAQYNNDHPNHKLGAKLRISTTVNTPDWVLDLAGGPVEVVINKTTYYNIGLFWTEEYRQAWHELQMKLAEEFDTHQLIREVCVSSPAMATDEPLATIFNQATIINLHDKGYTDAAFERALNGILDDYSCWEKTPIDFSFNTHRKIDSGVPVKDEAFAVNLMKDFKNRYRERAVLSNHGLQENLSLGALPIYQTFTELGGSIATQTKGPQNLTDQTFKVGLSYGVSEFEIWDSKEAGGYAYYNDDDLHRWKGIIDNY